MHHNHIHPFVGSLLAFLGTLASSAELELWLKLTSLAIGTLAGILGCLSAIKNLRK